MFSSARNLPSKHWKRTLSPQSQHRLLHGSYPPTEPLRIAHSPDQRSWNSGSTLQPMVPWSSTMSVPSSQDLSYFDHIFPSLTGGHEYGSSQNPSEVLTTEHFSAPCQGLGLSNGMEALYTSPDPWNSLTLGSSCCANTSFHEPLTSNCGSSNCETPSMDDDIPLDFDFDFGSDLRIAPVGSTASEWNTLFSSTGLPYQGSRPGFHTGNDIQGFDLDRFEAQTFRNDFDVTASFDGISRNTQDETAVDESSMPQDLQDILLTSGRLEQPRISPSMDVESFKCEAPGCGKIFNKRHRYNKHLLSHSRVLRCPFKNCKRRAYQEKDIKTHIAAVHHKAKIPCPIEGCPYSRHGPKGGISRKDALMRHLRNHDVNRTPTQDAPLS